MAVKKIISGGGPQADGVQLGVTGEKIGFAGATPIVRPAHANQAIPTDEATLIAFCTQLRADLIALGLIKGEA